MSTVKRFSEKERAYDAYLARQNYLRMQGSINRYQKELEEALAQERAAREDAMGQMEAALRQMEAERLAKEAERQAREVGRQGKEAERQAKEAALAEVARLLALLRGAQPPSDA